MKERGTIANRIQRLIESANIKLSQVASDALGVSGRLMLRSLCEGETGAEKLSALARGSLKQKQSELRRALTHRLSPHITSEPIKRRSQMLLARQSGKTVPSPRHSSPSADTGLNPNPNQHIGSFEKLLAERKSYAFPACLM